MKNTDVVKTALQSGFFSAAILVLLLLVPSLGATPLEDALRPLNDGIPQVAVERLQKFLDQHPAPTEAALAKARLGEALVRSGRPEAALLLLGDSSLTTLPLARFWRGQALAALGRWTEARFAYQHAAAVAPGPLRDDALFGEAESLRALGQREEALRLLGPLQRDARWGVRASLGRAELLLERGDLARADQVLRAIKPDRQEDRNERRYLFGRIHLAKKDYARASEILSVILQRPEGVPHPLLLATLLAIADAHLQNKTPDLGDNVLEEFIDHHPTDSALPEVFAKLDELYRAEEKPSPNELQRWVRDPAQPRRALARWYFARLQARTGDHAGAIAILAPLPDTPARLPSLGEGDIELTRLLLQAGRWDAAIAAAAAARRQSSAAALVQEADWLTAEAHYRAGRLDQAAPIFEQVAQSAPGLAGDALFNAALCWLRLDRTREFTSDYQRISNDPAKQQVQGELLLEEGALQAAQGKPEAALSYQNFIRDFPNSPRVSEAWVALAELAFHARKPDLEEARQDLARARQNQPTPAAIERADYLDIWLTDAAPGSDETRVIASASAFLRAHPGSAFTSEVRMKLAEGYFRRQDFANAQTQFELLAQQNPNAPLTEKALFFAGRSAMSSMGAASLDRALALFGQVVKLNGDLKWAARNEEAVIERRLGKNSDALAIYDEVLKNEAKPPDHWEALCGKGDVLYEMGATDPQNYRRAIALFEQLANEPGVPAHWRNQAEFKKGKGLEKLNDKPAALTTYYGVIENGAEPNRQHEFFWFYKAGFNAAHLLEEASDWKAAVAVYRKLAAVGGTRSDEAKARLTQLRLDHFLWEE
jgi:tetratricopeptide (TPR) repeat protein